jgi:hypothetical protein
MKMRKEWKTPVPNVTLTRLAVGLESLSILDAIASFAPIRQINDGKLVPPLTLSSH